MISVQNLSYVYSPKTPNMKQALFNCDMEIADGDFFGIIGDTGAGKSTLISHFNALTRVQKNSGTVIVDETDLSKKKIDVVGLRAKVGMVFQYPENQLFDDTVEKDICFGPKNLGVSVDDQKALCRQAIELVGLNYDEIAYRSPFELSGGQKRRVAIAGVIAMKPKILVLDEPTAGLDPLGKTEIMNLVKRIKSVCPTIIMISHNMDEIATYCNKIAVMSAGKVMGVFTPRELFGNRETLIKCDVELPLVTEIASKLSELLPIRADILLEDELLDEIEKAVKNA